MITINLHRIFKTSTVTLGCFVFNKTVYYTVELPFLENRKDISCIPDGEYRCELRESKTNLSAKIDVAFEVLSVPERSQILFPHVANSVGDIKGCIGAGLGIDIEGGVITNSIKAIKSFYRDMDKINGLNPFNLRIVS